MTVANDTAPGAEGTLAFPDGFVWGAATAAYQIEGGARDDGRGPSIWDTFSRTPGRVFEGHTGDVACDHYHRYREDVALIADLNLAAYRFSISWPRIQPDGSGPVEPRGLDFYDRLVDELQGRGVAPAVTLYHWDLPQTLEDRGGWTARETAQRFADFAEVVCARLGDRVETWITLNEPWCSAYLGYAAGIHAPGRQDPAAAFTAVHHLLLAHGLATQALRASGVATVALTLNPASVSPADPDSADDVRAARLVDGLHNRIFFDPVLRGRYPDDMLEHVGHVVDPATIVQADDLATIGEPIDLLGVNYYTPTYVAARAGANCGPVYPGVTDAEILPPAGPVTDMGWQVEPAALRRLLERISHDYPEVPLMITENGAAYSTEPVADEAEPGGLRVPDIERVRYLDGHLRAAHEAIAAGVDLRGYFVWSLMDNYEWAQGYSKRFGVVHVDYRTQRRTLKDSARWYRDVAVRNGLAEPAT
jgi:beta-glucosidase